MRPSVFYAAFSLPFILTFSSGLLFSKSMSSLHFFFSMSPMGKTYKPRFYLSLAQTECTSHRFVRVFWGIFGWLSFHLYLPFMVSSSLLLVAWVTVRTPYLAFKANHRWIKVALHKFSVFCHLLGSLVSNLHVSVRLLYLGVHSLHDTSKYRKKKWIKPRNFFTVSK